MNKIFDDIISDLHKEYQEQLNAVIESEFRDLIGQMIDSGDLFIRMRRPEILIEREGMEYILSAATVEYKPYRRCKELEARIRELEESKCRNYH